MTRFPERSLIAALLATVVVLAAGTVARARTGFDGIWSVTIITDSGACDRAYRAPVRIINGQVASEGDRSFNIFGRVQPSGRVVVAVSRGGQRADGSGRLSGRQGHGAWSSPAGCAADGKPSGAVESLCRRGPPKGSRIHGGHIRFDRSGRVYMIAEAHAKAALLRRGVLTGF